MPSRARGDKAAAAPAARVVVAVPAARGVAVAPVGAVPAPPRLRVTFLEALAPTGPGRLPVDQALVGIPRGCPSSPPEVVALTGEFLLQMQLHPTDRPLPSDSLVLEGLAPSTRRGHHLHLAQRSKDF